MAFIMALMGRPDNPGMPGPETPTPHLFYFVLFHLPDFPIRPVDL